MGAARAPPKSVIRMTIFDQALSFIAAPAADAFERVALDVFRYQAANVPPYRRYLESRDIKPEAVQSLAQVPYISTVAFKYARLETRAEPPSGDSRLFLTSGTSIGREERGRHLVIHPEVYRASAIGHLRRMLFADGRRTAMLAMHPIADAMPESSLSQMISWCIEEFGSETRACAAGREGVDPAAAIEFLAGRARVGEPVAILGTTASCAALFSAMDESHVTIALAPGSRLMDTGGAKGQIVPLTIEQVVSAAERLLGIAPRMVINEYGMTEMCSQLYDATGFNSEADPPPAQRVKIGPPWLRPVALHPLTLEPVTDGEVGMMSFFDLANVGAVSALMTEDFGVVRAGAVTILGRATAADARGCALAIEEFSARAAAPIGQPS
jgi:hypothetical protein